MSKIVFFMLCIPSIIFCTQEEEYNHGIEIAKLEMLHELECKIFSTSETIKRFEEQNLKNAFDSEYYINIHKGRLNLFMDCRTYIESN